MRASCEMGVTLVLFGGGYAFLRVVGGRKLEFVRYELEVARSTFGFTWETCLWNPIEVSGKVEQIRISTRYNLTKSKSHRADI